MARFLAIHNFGPGAREMFQQGAPQMLAAMKEIYPQIVWNGAHIEWETGKAVCVWEAPSMEAIKELFAQLQTPYEDIFPVEWTSPHDMAAAAAE